MISGHTFLRSHEKPFIFTPMFSKRTISLYLPYSGRLLAGLLLRVAR